jgi:hypothetical protein
MSDWVEDDPSPPRVKEWLHVPTGVELFVAENGEGYGLHIQATEGGSVDRVSIGDPDTGLFEEFDHRERAIRWADEWKEREGVLLALEKASSFQGDGADS